jgi:membrane-associated phospholipid phosphatase
MNQAIFLFFYNLPHGSPFWNNVAVFFADIFPYIVMIMAGIFLLMHHEVLGSDTPWEVLMEKKKEILKVFFAAAAAWILAHGLKVLLHVHRPFETLPDIHNLLPETGYSFPSGHAAFFASLAVSIFLVHRKAGYWFMFCALLIGIARIVIGVHFPIDILGGYALGGSVAYFLRKI